MKSRRPLRVAVLGSGSAGNATVVSDGITTILIDCGFSAKEVSARMESLGIDARSVSAVLVTHEHSDHVRGLDVFTRRRAPESRVIASGGTLTSAAMRPLGTRAERIQAGDALLIGTLQVRAFATSHDAAEPIGFRIEGDGCVLGFATDTGVLTEQALEGIADVDVLCLECNHDLHMLEKGPYPSFLKRRISSSNGHLSNADAADALERLATDRLAHVIGMHRSTTNNEATLVERALRSRLAGLHHPASVDVAGPVACVAVEIPARG